MLKTSYWYGSHKENKAAAADQDGKPAAGNQEQIEEAEFYDKIDTLLAKTKQFNQE